MVMIHSCSRNLEQIPFQTDVVVIGAGPVGLFTVFECGMMKLGCHVIDTLPRIGGQCTALYPEKPIYDIPGFPKIQAQHLVDNLTAQAAPFHPIYHLDQQVLKVDKHPENGRWHVTTSKNSQIQAKIIIIAAGVGAFGPKRPPLPNIELFENTSVHYFVAQRETYRDKKVVIAGGGDSAVDWALSLSEVAEKIYFVHRRPKFRAAPESVVQLLALSNMGKIELIVPYQLKELKGTEQGLAGVVVETLEGQQQVLPADYLLPFFGLAIDLGPIATWGLSLEKNHICTNPGTAQTNFPGIYAVGDIATYPYKQKLILTGFAEAAQAARAARSYIYPNEPWHFEYSTTQGIPQETMASQSSPPALNQALDAFKSTALGPAA